jgi:ABC-type multidrug transport system ATPase subunit/ABC-type transporter Mla maintaining outer membrane lipid asymmetry permease subunit MlaE
VRAGGRAILQDVEADFLAGGTTLIVGPSGAGKSVLLRLLAGLITSRTTGFEVEGQVRIGERDLLADGVRPRAQGASPAGIVFQSFALFDELSAEENILFGRDHRRGGNADPRGRGALARGLMAELGIPAGCRVALLSGGQKQRLAIARALAFDAELIAYDEPTSGLDPRNAVRVVELIRSTGEVHGKTTLVVTHNWSHFAPIAGRVYLLEGGGLRAVSREELAEWEGAPARTGGPAAICPEAPEPGPRAPALARRLVEGLRAAPGALARFLAGTSRAAESVLRAALALLPLWRSPRWGLRYLLHYLTLVASPSAWVYFGAAGVISGFVSTYFTFKFLPFRAYTEPLLTEELLHGLGFGLYRIIVPVLITVLLAARCGAAVASDVGTRRYTLATDAMESMGARPERYLLTNVLYGFLLGTPFVIALSFVASRLTSLLVFTYNYPQYDPFFWDSHFHRNLRLPGELLYRGSGWLLLKVLLAGLGIGTIAYHQGMRPKHSAVDVNRGITSTIIWSTLFVLLVHFAFAFLEFEGR